MPQKSAVVPVEGAAAVAAAAGVIFPADALGGERVGNRRKVVGCGGSVKTLPVFGRSVSAYRQASRRDCVMTR